MSEKLMGKCNKCGAEYEAAPVGTIHKCGKCSGGMVIVEGREIFVPINTIDPLPLFPTGKFDFSQETSTYTESRECYPSVKFVMNNEHYTLTTRETVEKEICDYLLGNTNLPYHGIDPHIAAFVANQIITNRRYLGKDS